MKFYIYLWLVLFMPLCLCCSSEGEDDNLTKSGPFDIIELSGNWNATAARFSNSSQWLDVVDEGGTVTMSVQTSGRFTMTIAPADRIAYTVAGEMFWEKWEGTFYFAIQWDNYPDDWDTYGHNYDGLNFSLSGGFGSGEYDFDNDGDFEACSVSMDFVRL
jgi:hypothetical protein